MDKEKIEKEKWEIAFDEQWKETNHYIIWGNWVKDAIKKIIQSQKAKEFKVELKGGKNEGDLFEL